MSVISCIIRASSVRSYEIQKSKSRGPLEDGYAENQSKSAFRSFATRIRQSDQSALCGNIIGTFSHHSWGVMAWLQSVLTYLQPRCVG